MTETDSHKDREEARELRLNISWVQKGQQKAGTKEQEIEGNLD